MLASGAVQGFFMPAFFGTFFETSVFIEEM
jgi:hypothetical protein